jgi:hypothetical protein
LLLAGAILMALRFVQLRRALLRARPASNSSACWPNTAATRPSCSTPPPST